MGVEIRTLREDELEAYLRLDAYAFGYELTSEQVARYRAHTRLEWMLAAFHDGRMVSHLLAYPWRMAINGARVALAGVADVATWPEHRRAGYTGALLRASLGWMRARGLVLAMLYPTFYALYRRFGWALAAEKRRYAAPATAFAPAAFAAPAAGRAERLTDDLIGALGAMYDRWLASANGALERDEAHWRWRTLYSRAGPPHAVQWRGANGEADGYVLYRGPQRGPGREAAPDQELDVLELVALTPDGYRGLITYLARHDLVRRLHWSGPPDDPLRSLITDPAAVHVEAQPSFMLRLVDVPRALAARGYLPGPPTRLIVQVRDAVAPWNDGSWALTVEDGAARVVRTSADPHLSLDVATLAALYNGFLSPRHACLTGLVRVADHAALDAASRLFAVTTPPFCPDYF